MKIVYISKSIIPSRSANSIHVMKMCQALAQLGHEVILLAPRSRKTEPGITDPFAFYGVEPCFELRYASVSRGYGWWTAVTARREKADLVYGRYLNGCVYAGWLGLPTIFESHAPDHEGKRWDSWLFGKMLDSSQLRCLVVITQALSHYYQQQYSLPSTRIQVVPDAADPPSPIKAADALVLDNSRLHVGYIGQLYTGKGMELIYQLAQQCPWAVFHVVGGAENDLAHWWQRANGQDNLILHGFVPHAQTNRYQQAFDVALAPYQQQVAVYGGRGDVANWMSPLKLFEYMAAGKAIICSDLPVLREVLRHEETALLCPPDDLPSWQAALVRLRDDMVLRQRLGTTAQQTFREKYTWTARARRVLAIAQETAVAHA